MKKIAGHNELWFNYPINAAGSRGDALLPLLVPYHGRVEIASVRFVVRLYVRLPVAISAAAYMTTAYYAYEYYRAVHYRGEVYTQKEKEETEDAENRPSECNVIVDSLIKISHLINDTSQDRMP